VPTRASIGTARRAVAASLTIPPLADVTWHALDASRASFLAASRLVPHHALQFPSGFGIAYATALPDDSHTSLRWDQGLGALAAPALQAPIGGVTLGLRLGDLTLLLLTSGGIVRELTLGGVTCPPEITHADSPYASSGAPTTGALSSPNSSSTSRCALRPPRWVVCCACS
jgi:hypothetical protein